MHSKLAPLVALSAVGFSLLRGGSLNKPESTTGFTNNIPGNETPLLDLSSFAIFGMVGGRREDESPEDEIQRLREENKARLTEEIEKNKLSLAELLRQQVAFNKQYDEIETNYNTVEQKAEKLILEGKREEAKSILKSRLSPDKFEEIKTSKKSMDESIDLIKNMIRWQEQQLKDIDTIADQLILKSQITQIQDRLTSISSGLIFTIESEAYDEATSLINDDLAGLYAEQEVSREFPDQRITEMANAQKGEESEIEQKVRELESKISPDTQSSKSTDLPIFIPPGESPDDELSSGPLVNRILGDLDEPPSYENPAGGNPERDKALAELGLSSIDEIKY